jgi:putative FmdB family regulatory protein
MPIYEYRCEKGHTFEVLQRMSDDPIEKCEVCGAPVHRVFHPVAVHFKGSGFYNTDYGKQKRAAAEAAGSNNSTGDGKPETPKKPEKKAETPAASSSSD